MTRLRVIKHVSDKRRTKCSSIILGGQVPRVENEQIQILEELDRAARREACKNGHTAVPAVGQAKNASGRCVGRVQL